MICETMAGDNRFEIIAKAKHAILEGTNIDTSEDEMKVLDNFLFRCWQMGWLDKYDDSKTGWILVSERLPKCEQEVLICTEKKLVGRDAYIDSIVTPAIYEDGTMLEVESIWSWYDMDFDEWNDEEDCGIIPMGWFENRHFNPDEVYNNPVDRKVVAWMPLPEPYRGEEE